MSDSQAGSTTSHGPSASTAGPSRATSAQPNGTRPSPAPQTGNAPVVNRVQPGATRPQQQAQAGPSYGSAAQQQTGGTAGIVRRTTLNSILVATVQKGNPLIQNIRSVPWEYGDIKCDYQVGATSGVLYLSLRYHLLHPEYIHVRIKNLAHSYALRIMLVQCDVDNHQAAIRELTKTCIVNEYTMIVAWSTQEAARYLETYKAYERKPPDLIKERVDSSYMAHLTSALTSVKGVNKTDVTTLASNFGTFKNIVNAPSETLASLPGLGDKKVRRLREAFEASFVQGRSDTSASGSGTAAKKRRTTSASASASLGPNEFN